MPKMRKVLNGLLCGTLFATSAALIAPTASQALPSADCNEVVIIPFRGSGEPSIGLQSYGNLGTAGGEGPTLARLLASAYAEYPELADVPVLDIGPDYESVSVPIGVLTASFERSIRSGVSAATKVYDRFALPKNYGQPGACGAPQVILLGYSQGASVARRTAEAFKDRGVVTAVMTVGDPYQKSNADGVFGSGSNGNGIWRKEDMDGFYSLPNVRRMSICHKDEGVCDSNKYIPDLTWGPHKNYFEPGVKFQAGSNLEESDTDEVDFMARALNTNVRIARERYAASQSTSQVPRDTVFAIDTTGSMGSYINSARQQATDIATRLMRGNPSSRIGLVEYRDHGDDFVAREVVPLTPSVSEFTAGLGRLYPDGGGDTPEAVFSGIVESLKQPFNRNAARSIIVIGDAQAKDPEPVTGYTSASIIEALAGRVTLESITPRHTFAAPSDVVEDRNAGQFEDDETASPAEAPAAPQSVFARTAAAEGSGTGMPITLYGIGTGGLTNSLRGVATSSGGDVYASGSDVAAALEAAIESIDERPVAIVDGLSTAIIGEPAYFGCAGSHVSVGEMTATFEIDGKTLECTPDFEYTFSTRGVHTVGLTVTDERGRTSYAEITVDVLGPIVDEAGTGDGSGSLGSAGSLGSQELGGSLGSVFGSFGSSGS